MQRNELEKFLNELFKPELINDFCPNGLQIQGADEIATVVTGVTATKALIEQAIVLNADAIVVHHGYFWKNESYVLRGMKYERIKALFAHNISLFAYHLPLDIHPTLGNNAQLAQLLGITITGPLEQGNDKSIAIRGEFNQEISPTALTQLLTDKLKRACLHIPPESNKSIKTVAWCSGGGQHYIELAAQQGIDAFITGEVSEQTTHIAREMDIHFYAAGHHATERYGVKALADYLQAELALKAIFVDIDNPV